MASDGNKFNDFPENQMTNFHAEFPNFMQNLLIIVGGGVWSRNWEVLGVSKYHCSKVGVRGSM